MVAGSAGDLRFHHVLLLQFEAEFFGCLDPELRIAGNIGFRVITEIVDFFEWPEIFLWCTVAIQTPAH